jgi:hypothetical protein
MFRAGRLTGSARPKDESSPVHSREDAIAAVVAGALAVGLLALRAPIAARQFWAEDGAVFFQAAIDDGPWAPFLAPYGGYFHTVPRAIGAIASIAPLDAAPLVVWLLVAAVVAWCAATICRAAPPWVRSIPLRLLLASSLVAIPAMGDEALANAANLQWILLFTAIVVLISPVGGSRLWVVNGSLVVVTSALSSPLAVTLAPLVAVRWWFERRKRPDAVAISWALATLVQIGAVLLAQPARAEGNALSIRRIVTLFGERVAFRTFVPIDGAVRLLTIVVVLSVSAVVCVAVGLAWHARSRQRAVVLVTVGFVAGALYVFTGRRLGLDSDLPPRYELVPAWSLLWLCMCSLETILDASLPTLEAGRRRLVSGLVVLVVAVAWIGRWQPDPYRLDGPTWADSVSFASARCEDDEHRVGVVIMPTVGVEAGWKVEMRCDRLR